MLIHSSTKVYQTGFKLPWLGSCTFQAIDEHSAFMLGKLSEIMGLNSLTSHPQDAQDPLHHKIVKVFTDCRVKEEKGEWPDRPFVRYTNADTPNNEYAILKYTTHQDIQVLQLNSLAFAMARHFQQLGGALLHGALVVRNGAGIILGGESGAGKSTACERMPDGWLALSDDATFVVPTADGGYQAHPWPTWSKFIFGGAGGNWQIDESFPLQAILFLRQQGDDSIHRVGGAEATCFLNGSIKQLSYYHVVEMGMQQCLEKELYKHQFAASCSISNSVDVGKLEMSENGLFHDAIDNFIQRPPVVKPNIHGPTCSPSSPS